MSEATRTVYLDGGDEKLELEEYRLTVLEGPDEGETFSCDARQTTIGSSPENDVVLDDPSVSRFHAVVEVGDEGYLLRDRESKNGTFLEGHRIREVYLGDGSAIRLGRTVLEFDRTGEEVEVHLSGRNQFGDLIGQSSEMREIFSLLERVAPTEATVLVEGESGTGKELVARALHDHHPERKDGPFVVIDCSAIPADLIESELFGHVEGAFTGATEAREGAFVAAEGGTLFLDELGELNPDLQPKLLRALENEAIKPVGSNETIETDVRIVAATNRNLEQEIEEGRFREDLYYRFAVVTVELPPLRERTEDIPMLVEHFLGEATEMAGRDEIDVAYETMEKLKRHDWPGNVRELKNFVERAVLLTQGDEIETRFLDSDDPAPSEPEAAKESASSMAELAIRESLPFKDAKNRLVEEFERTYWRELLERTGGNVSEAARHGDVHRKSVEYILKKHDISREDFD
ncbi:MAG: sigma 54-interacting transcriptional regulator [Bradymonadaceae bacterium]